MNTLRTFSFSKLLIALLWLPVTVLANQADTVPPTSCPVESSWLTAPSLPIEVKKSGSDGTSSFCDFYQFSTQTFLYLMSPVKDRKDGQRNFQVQANYPVLEGTPKNSCDDIIEGSTLRTSLKLMKTGDDNPFPTGQAGGGATIYAQDGNVVYYEVRFNKALCDLSGSAVELQKKDITNFPPGTMELKFGWKVLSDAEIAAKTFVTQPQTIAGKNKTMGLVGMHLATATKEHPEFIWATYEHNNNTPNCTPPDGQTTAWTFANAKCTNGLPGTAAKDNDCKFNQPPKNKTDPTGTPTNICRINPFGTAFGDLKAAENLTDITTQNSQLQALFAQPTTPSTMKELSNYFTVGALWVSDTTKSSGGVGVPNERGSLRLANTVAETDYQDVNLNSGFASNCFGCHTYTGTSQPNSNNITSQALSHSFKSIKIGQGQSIDVAAGKVINDNKAAADICGISVINKGVCDGAGLKWNGNWTNVNASAGSVCGCTKPSKAELVPVQ